MPGGENGVRALAELLGKEAKPLTGKHGVIQPEHVAVIDEELPPAGEVERLMRSFGMPVSPAEIGIGEDEARFAFLASKDIRDKYVATRLLWDLGILEDVAGKLAF